MTYKIYITRATHPKKAAEAPIQLDEWVNLVKTIPDLHIQETESSPLPGQPASREGLVRWAAHPFALPIWFSFENHMISTENPDGYTAMRMRNLANRLNARLHGW